MENHSPCEQGRQKMWELFRDNPDFPKEIGKMVRGRVKSQGTKMWKSPSRDGSIEPAIEEYMPWENPARVPTKKPKKEQPLPCHIAEPRPHWAQKPREDGGDGRARGATVLWEGTRDLGTEAGPAAGAQEPGLSPRPAQTANSHQKVCPRLHVSWFDY